MTVEFRQTADARGLARLTGTNLEPRSLDNRTADQIAADSGPMTGQGKYFTTLRFFKYERPNVLAPANTSPSGTKWTLPLPLELSDMTAASFSNIELESVGDLINNSSLGSMASAMLSRNSGDLAQAAMGVGGQVAGLLPGAVGDVAQGAVNTLAAQFPAAAITSALQQAGKDAPNPNHSVAFQGPMMRDHNFSWTLFPDSPEQSEKIARMIRELKRRSLPTIKYSGSASMLNYPDLVQINFYPWDQTAGANVWGWGPDSIIRIKKCFIKSVNVNYTAGNAPAFFEGTNLPVVIALSLNLVEIDYMLSYDWDDAAGNISALSNIGSIAAPEPDAATQDQLGRVVDQARGIVTGGTPLSIATPETPAAPEPQPPG